MRKAYIGAMIGAFGAAALGAYIAFAPPFVISFSQDEVQQRINDVLPKDIMTAGVTVEVDRLRVDILDTNQIRIVGSADISGHGMAGAASVDATTAIRYVSGDFFLTSVTLDDIEADLDARSADEVDRLKSTAGAMWGKFKNKHLQDSPDAQAHLEDMAARAAEKVKGKAADAINSTLATTPIYSLNGKGLKMDLASAALTDVRFTAGMVEVHLDPAQAGVKILLYVTVAISAALAALGLIRNPSAIVGPSA